MNDICKYGKYARKHLNYYTNMNSIKNYDQLNKYCVRVVQMFTRMFHEIFIELYAGEFPWNWKTTPHSPPVPYNDFILLSFCRAIKITHKSSIERKGSLTSSNRWHRTQNPSKKGRADGTNSQHHVDTFSHRANANFQGVLEIAFLFY